MMKIHYDLIELFENGVAEGKHVLDVTGEDVATFCEELLKSAETYTENWREKLNREIMNKVSSKK
jgi:DNA-binding ferritin-like protein (Dps family)